MAVTFKRFYLEADEQPFEVEEDVWVMEPSPEHFGIRLVYSHPVYNDDIARVAAIKDWLDRRGVWNLGELIYFDTEAERLEFELTWL